MGLYVSQKIEIWTPIWDPHGLPRASKIDLQSKANDSQATFYHAGLAP